MATVNIYLGMNAKTYLGVAGTTAATIIDNITNVSEPLAYTRSNSG